MRTKGIGPQGLGMANNTGGCGCMEECSCGSPNKIIEAVAGAVASKVAGKVVDKVMD
jgi:hypothetical protein